MSVSFNGKHYRSRSTDADKCLRDIKSSSASFLSVCQEFSHGDLCGTCGSKFCRPSLGAGNTPIHVAAQADKRLVVSCLMWGGADITLTNESGNTVLHECARVNAKELSIWLCLVEIPKTKLGVPPTHHT
eukprot:323716-Amphidinium_carterae.1